MSAAHTSIRSALTQAFRLSNNRGAASCCVPVFLVPAFNQRPRRPFSSTRRRRAELEQPAQTALEHPTTSNSNTTGSKELLPSRNIPLPGKDARGNIETWLATIDPFLPPHLRRRSEPHEQDISASITCLDLAMFLVSAQEASQDILSHLGLAEQRWDALVWIAKKLSDVEKQSIEISARLDPLGGVAFPETYIRSLDDLTNNPLLTQRVRPSKKLAHTLDSMTAAPKSTRPRYRLIKQGLGQLWRSLGSMILSAAEENHEADAIMSRVLEIIAYLHHVGLIPDSVYTNRPVESDYALQQPPTLHLLSSKILTALSDATWRAHEASVKVATERLNASYFLGHEIPGSRYKIQVTEVAPELWLELVLWSCLHGGWILDGSAILEQVSSRGGSHTWGLISGRELLQAREQDSIKSKRWTLFQRREDALTKAEDRARAQRTISSEVVTAFIDGLVNDMRLGIGARGTDPEDLVGRIKKLKHLLDLNSLSLGSTTWDSIISRLLETGGFVPEKRPELLLSMLDLASGFGTEVNTINASSKASLEDSEPPYFFEPTTVPLSLLHRTMRSFVTNGDLAGAMTTLKTLQQYTDNNKQRSLQQFFESLKHVPVRNDDLFSSGLPPIEFPAFENQLPIPLLANLLDLVTDAKMYDIGRWLLFSDDLDGPLIPTSLYGTWLIAASIIRFGTMAGEHDLVLTVVERTGVWSSQQQEAQRLPHEFLTALLCSQIKLHRWKSVKAMQEYVLDSSGYRPQPEVLANFAAELLRSAMPASSSEPSAADKTREAFTDFLYTWEQLILSHTRNELYCILGVLSTVHEGWRSFCFQFLVRPTFQNIDLSSNDFNLLLGGVLDKYGSGKGQEVVNTWCYTNPGAYEPYRAPGGLPTMSKFRMSKSDELKSKPENIEIVQPSGVKLVLQGRVYHNRQTIRAILQKVRQEEDEREQRSEEATVAKRAEVFETLKWASSQLYHLGFDYEDIIRDLGSLADLADLEAPSAAPMLGSSEGEPGL